MALLAQDTLPPAAPDTGSVTRVFRPRPQVPRVRPVKKIDSTLLLDSFQAVRPLQGSLPLPYMLSDTFFWAHHGFYRFDDPVRYGVSLRKWEGKEPIFYTIIGLLLLFAMIKNGFHRYIDDLFKIFFRTTVKQRQIKEQLMESPLPSMLLNLYFLISGGMFLALLIEDFGLGTNFGFWELFGYASLGLFLIYSIKYLSLKVLGWIFQIKDAVDSYIFIVFSTNKVLGMLLLPFVVVLAFTSGPVIHAVIIASLALVGGLLAYRFFLSYATIHRQVRVSFFHFFLYLCAFELAPLLLINKLLFRLLGETY
jgi:hypothetical protein